MNIEIWMENEHYKTENRNLTSEAWKFQNWKETWIWNWNLKIESWICENWHFKTDISKLKIVIPKWKLKLKIRTSKNKWNCLLKCSMQHMNYKFRGVLHLVCGRARIIVPLFEPKHAISKKSLFWKSTTIPIAFSRAPQYENPNFQLLGCSGARHRRVRPRKYFRA